MRTTTSSLDGTDVLVVGAGTGGLTAALLLADAGANVTLLERVAKPAAVGAGIVLHANGLAVLAALGLHDALRQAGRRISSEPILSRNGKPILTVAIPDYGHGLDHMLGIRRSALNEILLDAVSKRPAIVTRFGAEVTAARSAGSVDTHWHEVISTITADLIIGADGIHSTVRAGGDFGARSRPVGGPYIRGLLTASDLDLHGQYWTPSGIFGGVRLDDTTFHFYADATAPAMARAVAERDLAAVAHEWAKTLPLAGQVLARAGGFDDLLVHLAIRVDCERWDDGRLVLLGDAAHAMAPLLGQGANSAIVDAAVLVGELATTQPLPTALARYTRRRQPAVRKVQDSADRMVALCKLGNPGLRRIRDVALRLLNRWPGGTRRLEQMVMQEHPAHLYRELVQRYPAKP